MAIERPLARARGRERDTKGQIMAIAGGGLAP